MRLDNRSEYVQIDWTVGNTCNYDCSYCPTNSKDGSWGWPDIEQCRTFVETLVKTYKNKKLYFVLLGGEITLWKQFIDFVDMLRNTASGCKIKLLTNGIMPARFWKKHGYKFDKIQFSFHTSANIDKFIENVNASSSKVNQIFVMIDPSCFKKSIEVYNILCNAATNAYSIEGKLVDSRAGKPIIYTEEQRNKISSFFYFNKNIPKATSDLHLYEVYDDHEVRVENPMIYIHKNKNNWLGWHCYIGLEKLALKENGNITRGSSCSVGGIIGNWRNNTLDLNNFSPVICNMRQCMCGADIVISRHK